jgi:hypothetical protein
MAGIGGRMAIIHQMLGLTLAPISTICRGGRKMVEMVEMGETRTPEGGEERTA